MATFETPFDLDRMLSESEQALRRLNEATAELESVVGEGQAADGTIRASVDQGGRLREITLDPRAMRNDSQTLGELVTAAVQVAQDDAAQQVQALLTSTLGDDIGNPLDLSTMQAQFQAAEDAFSRALAGHSDNLDRLGRDR
ncbi:YbaB/EbfC family nucleoid-associated protein [Sinosporangium siamense]|uniref:YbaB/EbfC family nucleoid-associated protein n=1 Tax=Sinosporangium siamense TaxID=1367973 RepID=A0A919RQV9_9ACTN|nr:YbaB/EbfC family nucleoid-associated protein [Sinosporangium siamense]GII97049.1 hypothetical protein Ssi02_72800 [Sinosporangium siamense]